MLLCLKKRKPSSWLDGRRAYSSFVVGSIELFVSPSILIYTIGTFMNDVDMSEMIVEFFV